MTITHKVSSFPTFPIRSQLFHVPGASFDGGLTSGSARITSPEPGGYSMLEIQPAMFNEWEYPISSWLMSKTNGDILRVRLAPTPQIASARSLGVPWGAEGIYPESLWSNLQNWSGDMTAVYASAALEGSAVVVIDMSELGPVLKPGHVIGHANECYKIDEIEYDGANVATITVKPPLRRNVAINDNVYFRPWFTGQIINPAEFAHHMMRTKTDLFNSVKSFLVKWCCRE